MGSGRPVETYKKTAYAKVDWARVAATADDALFTYVVERIMEDKAAAALMHAHIPHKKRKQLWVWLQSPPNKTRTTTHLSAAHVIMGLAAFSQCDASRSSHVIVPVIVLIGRGGCSPCE